MTSAPDEACWSDGSYETIVQQGSPLVFKTACHRRADSQRSVAAERRPC